MDNIKENSSVIITGHILIKDRETDEILLNKSESSLTLITKQDNKRNAG